MLEQHTHTAAVFIQLVSRKARQIPSFNQNLPGLRTNLSCNQPHQRGFAAARTAHYGSKIALRNTEIDVLQNRAVAIRKGDIFHFDKREGTHVQAKR